MARYALLIGNDAYQDPRLSRLQAPLADVMALRRVLIDPAIGGFQPDRVEVCLNPSLGDAAEAVSRLFAGRRTDDLLLLYFSGHGILPVDGQLDFALAHSRYDLPATMLSAATVRREMNNSRSHRQVVILDCCNAGAFGRAGTKGASGAAIGATAIRETTFEPHGYGREILAASTDTQFALDGDSITGEGTPSLFTRFLIEGLESGSPAEGRPEITVEQLYRYTHDRVVAASEGQMTPWRWVDRQQGGSLVIARNPRPEKRAPKEAEPEEAPTADSDPYAALADPDPRLREGTVNDLCRRMQAAEATEAATLRACLEARLPLERDRYVYAAIERCLADAKSSKPQRRGTPIWRYVLPVLLLVTVLGVVVNLSNRQSAPTAAQGPDATGTPLEPEMAQIPAGCFQMGSPGEQHEVCVEAFALAKHEVTVGQFRAFIEATGHETDAEKGGGCLTLDGIAWVSRLEASWRAPGFEQTDAHPVVCVSWNDAVAYAEWRSEGSGKGYRLPTEAEWEYAARAGTETSRYWGDDPDQACRYANGHDQTSQRENGFDWTHHDCDDGYAVTAPIGQFQPNDFRLYDMLGNVWEWTADCWHPSYEGAPVDGSARGAGSGCAQRVVRGGGWNGSPEYLRSAVRSGSATGGAGFNVGFRLARAF